LEFFDLRVFDCQLDDEVPDLASEPVEHGLSEIGGVAHGVGSCGQLAVIADTKAASVMMSAS